MPEFFPWLDDELQTLEQQGLRRYRRTVVPLADGCCELDGQRLFNFASNDYLNRAGDPRLREAARVALDESGSGSRASALVTGRTQWHEQLESRLAEFEQQPAALLFPSGFAANMGTIAALTTAEDVIFCERFNHASLVDGCQLSPATLRVYRSDQLERLESELQKSAGARQRLIVTDSYFSMDGTLAPLPALCELAQQYDAQLIIDEAHATGVFGDSARGVAELCGVEERVAVRVGTLSKALGCLGGFVTGSERLVDWLWNKARPQIYSTALPPAVCAAAAASVKILQQEPGQGGELLNRSRYFCEQLRERGIEPIPGSVGPIVPLLVKQPEQAVAYANALKERGFLVPAIRPPTVPRGTSRLRISLTLAHSRETLAALAAAVGEIMNASAD